MDDAFDDRFGSARAEAPRPGARGLPPPPPAAETPAHIQAANRALAAHGLPRALPIRDPRAGPPWPHGYRPPPDAAAHRGRFRSAYYPVVGGGWHFMPPALARAPAGPL